jgi:hypothetical protein
MARYFLLQLMPKLRKNMKLHLARAKALNPQVLEVKRWSGFELQRRQPSKTMQSSQLS